MKRFYILIILLTVISSCSEPITYTVNCNRPVTGSDRVVSTAAEIVNITFNSGTKVLKNGDLTFPLKDIKVVSGKSTTKLIYGSRYPSVPLNGWSKKYQDTALYAEIRIFYPFGDRSKPLKIKYEEIRAEKGWKVVKQSFTFRGTVMNNDKTLPNQDVTKSIYYECSIPPNFNYKYVRT